MLLWSDETNDNEIPIFDRSRTVCEQSKVVEIDMIDTTGYILTSRGDAPMDDWTELDWFKPKFKPNKALSLV